MSEEVWPDRFVGVAHWPPVTAPRQYGAMVSAVIFDFYGTLAHFADTDVSNYETVFATHGYEPERAILDDYFARYNGVEHADHSVSEEAYEAWVRVRLRDLTGACGVPDPHVEDLVDALRASDQGPMVAYPEAATTLASLRRAGLAIGVCSNWGWELDGFLNRVGLLEFVDAGVTSARAGRGNLTPASTTCPCVRWASTRPTSSSSATRGGPTCEARGHRYDGRSRVARGGADVGWSRRRSTPVMCGSAI